MSRVVQLLSQAEGGPVDHAVDVSDLAVAWATRNRDRLGLDVEIVHGDAVTALSELSDVDVVVSNPPYIPTTAEPLDPEVRDHDPHVALYGGSEDGLAIPRLVAAPGMLDLDDVGAERSQDLGRRRAGERARQVQHAHPLQR